MWKEIDVPKNLSEKIINRIEFVERRSAKMRLVFFGALAVASVVAFIPALKYLINDLNNSGFYQYLSLVFSDSGIILASWKEFSLSLAESLPIFSTIIFLATIFIFLESIKLSIKNIKSHKIYELQI